MFVHAVTEASGLSGIFVPGAMDLVLVHPQKSVPKVCAIIASAVIAKENLCVLCTIAHGVVTKLKSPGRSDLSRKYAHTAGGPWIRLFGITVPGANTVLYEIMNNDNTINFGGFNS